MTSQSARSSNWWVTINVVWRREAAFSASITRCSLRASRLAAGSSNSNSEQGFSNARATATRCACPTERRAAWSPTGVSTPCGRSGRNSLTQALSSAVCNSCSLASGRASSTLSRNVAAGNCGFCPTQERCLRHDSGDKSRNSIPLIRSDP